MNKYRWPDRYKKLIIQFGEHSEIAHFGQQDTTQQLCVYCTGYKESADLLVGAVLESRDISRLDTAVYPIMFLYRQFIELSLKDAYLIFSQHCREEMIDALNKGSHDLGAWWNKFNSVLPRGLSEQDRATIDIVGSYIREFHLLDQGSFSFRYPITKALEPVFGAERSVNLRHLKERMDELESFFSGVTGFLGDK